MKSNLISVFIFLTVNTYRNHADGCGCKNVRNCYKNMVDTLLTHDEAACIEDAAVGTSTLMVYLKALEKFCGSIVQVSSDCTTYEGRRLYEVVVNEKDVNQNEQELPVIILEAGQEAGKGSVSFALYVLEQLISCSEYDDLIQTVRWVILPSSNPDGLEYTEHRPFWRKNLRKLKGTSSSSMGVDISRNFEKYWGSCDKVENEFSLKYQGEAAASENETVFVQNIIQKYKSNTKAYISIRRNGHGILYPYAYIDNKPYADENLVKAASEIAAKVNLRVIGLHTFVNDTIYKVNGQPHCGHSVDYAYDHGVPLSFEMRVFLEEDNKIVNMFQPLPNAYEDTLRSGYFAAIRQLYAMITNDKRYGMNLNGKHSNSKKRG